VRSEVKEGAEAAAPVSLVARILRGLRGHSLFSHVLRSFLTLAAGDGAARAIGAVAQIILIRRLNPGPYGLITLGIALVGWFALVVDSGTEQLNIREIAKEPSRFREFADPVLGLRITLSIVAGILLALGTYFLSHSPGSQSVLPRFALVLPAIAINLRWMVLGIREARAVAIGNVAARLAFLAAVVLVVTRPHYAGRVPYLEVLAEATYALVIIAIVSRRFGVPRPRVDLAVWRSTLTQGFPLLVYGACRATILTIDIILIALILGHGQAGLYGAALKPVALFLGTLGLFSVSFLAGYSSAPDGEATTLFRRSVLLGLGSMLAVAVALSAGSPLVSFVFGSKYSGSATSLAVLAWVLPIAALGVPYSTVLIARRRQDVLMHLNIVGAVVNVSANAIVITLVGIEAAAGVRVGTYALMLVLNHHACVSRGFAPSLGTVLSRLAPRAATGRSGA
jgi:O-antigen/teichoic acid export membrane protein